MRMTLLFLFLLVFHVQAEQSYSQVTKISLDMEDSSIEKILQSIEEKSEFYVLYNSKLINVDRKTDIHANEESIASVLTQLFDTNEVEYEVKGKQIILSPKEMYGQLIADTEAFQQQKRTITGTVADAAGLPIIGANIVEVGTTNGTVTDVDGKFSLNVARNATIHISYIGYLEQDISTEGNTTFNITLAEDTRALEELVVVGYGSMRKSDLTGSIVTVSPASFSKPSANIVQSIQGAVAGVTITQNSALPNASPEIRIRGINSISASSYPLVIIDGVPGNMNIINPNDIESLNILKDASACAIYGSRASNGVVIITTKRGKGKPVLNYNGYFGIKQTTKFLDFVGPEKYLYYRQKFSEHAGLPYEPKDVIHSTEEYDNYQLGRSTDWQNLLFKNAVVSEHNVSISGGEKSLNYFVSANYRDHDYFIGNYNLRRSSIRSNIDKEFMNWLKFGNNLSVIQSKSSGSDGGLRDILMLNPLCTPTDPDGNTYIWPMESNTDYAINPLTYQNAKTGSESIEINENIFAELKLPIEGLDYKISYGVTLVKNESDAYHGVDTDAGYKKNGLASKSTGNNTYWIFENIVNYNRVFGNHSLLFTGLYSAEKNKSRALSASSFDFANDVLLYNNLSAGGQYNPPYSDASAYSMNSIMGRIQYGYNNKYLLTLTMRRDGYSAFGKNQKYGNFPSAAIAWRIEQEDFMKNVSFISNLKLRL